MNQKSFQKIEQTRPYTMIQKETRPLSRNQTQKALSRQWWPHSSQRSEKIN